MSASSSSFDLFPRRALGNLPNCSFGVVLEEDMVELWARRLLLLQMRSKTGQEILFDVVLPDSHERFTDNEVAKKTQERPRTTHLVTQTKNPREVRSESDWEQTLVVCVPFQREYIMQSAASSSLIYS